MNDAMEPAWEIRDVDEWRSIVRFVDREGREHRGQVTRRVSADEDERYVRVFIRDEDDRLFEAVVGRRRALGEVVRKLLRNSPLSTP